MDFHDLARQVDAMRRRRASPADGPLDEAIEALDVTLEELRSANEEVDRLGGRLDQAHGQAEAEAGRYRALFELAPVGYLVTDRHGAIREANHAACALLNIRRAHVRGKPLAVFLPPEGRPAFRVELARLGHADRLDRWPARLVPRGRPPLHVTLSAAASRDAEGGLDAVLWAVHDVTERVEAEGLIRDLNAELEGRVLEQTAALREEIRSREALLIAAHAADASALELVHGLDAIAWESREPRRHGFVSRRAEELLGFPAALWAAEPGFWEGRLHPEDREAAIRCRVRAVQEGRDHEQEYRLVAADGRALWVRESVRLVRDAAGAVVGLRGLMVPIGRRKKVERQLFAAKRQLADELADLRYAHELLARLAPTAGVAELAPEVLGSVAALVGAERGALFARDPEGGGWALEAALGLPEPFARMLARVPADSPWRGRALAVDEPVVVADALAVPGHAAHLDAIRAGGFRAVFSVPLAARSGEPLGAAAVFFDEPHRPPERQARQAELYARKAAEFLENAVLRRDALEADRRKDQALAVLAHELRSPLAAVLHAAEDPEAEARALIARQARRMAGLVDDLLDASRLGRGLAALPMAPVDLAAVARVAARAARPRLDARGLRLALALPGGPAWVLGDAARLEQVAANLLDNAAKFARDGGEVGLAVELDPGEARLRVRDDGQGIAPELLPRVFDLFAQGDRTRGGMGIGLALVKGLAELHGGAAVAASPGPGRGSEFTVRLPRIAAPEPAADAPPAPAAATAARRVLIVDDHADSAHALARLLRASGHDVRVAGDGPEALTLAADARFDVVLLDVDLPGMAGPEVAVQLRAGAEAAGVPPPRLVALTGRSGGGDRDRSREAGCEAHLVKPVDVDRLRALIAGAATDPGA